MVPLKLTLLYIVCKINVLNISSIYNMHNTTFSATSMDFRTKVNLYAPQSSGGKKTLICVDSYNIHLFQISVNSDIVELFMQFLTYMNILIYF